MDREKLFDSAKRLIIIAAVLVFIAAAFTAAWMIAETSYYYNEARFDILFMLSLILQFAVVPCAMVLAVIGIVRAAKANARGEARGKKLVVWGAVALAAALSVWFWFFIERTLIVGMSV